ncbi:hypothetical protein ACO0RG_001140 [Hanseniaspora osmophila]
MGDGDKQDDLITTNGNTDKKSSMENNAEHSKNNTKLQNIEIKNKYPQNNESRSEIQEQIEEINQLFNILDYQNKGEISFKDFKHAIRNSDLIEKNYHPRGDVNKHVTANLHNLLSNYSNKTIYELFQKIDIDQDEFIDKQDFIQYYEKTEAQIKLGFQKIDLDKDGLIKSNDILKYLDGLMNSVNTKETNTTNKSDGDINNSLNETNYARIKKEFVKWAFLGNTRFNDPNFNTKDVSNANTNTQGITYDDFKLFLLFIPRNDGSRLKTAFNHYYYEYFLNKSDLDLSSDSDIIYINNSLKFFIAGGTSGVISRSCTAPLDRIKVFLIANEKNLHVWEVVKQIYRKGGGWKSFYVGNGLNSLKVFPESAIKFGTFELVKKLCFGKQSDDNPIVPYICGGLAGVMAQLSVYPIDTIKYRMQCENIKMSPSHPINNLLHPQASTASSLSSTKKMNNINIMKIIKDVYKINGIRSFYRGLNAGLMGMFPYAAIDLGTFNLMKNFFINKQCAEQGVRREDVVLPNILLLPMGAFSGSIGASIVYPINLLRTRLQAQGTFAHPHTYLGFFDCAKKTVMREGYRGLFKGLAPNLAKVCPAVGISYFCYENLKKALNIDSTF